MTVSEGLRRQQSAFIYLFIYKILGNTFKFQSTSFNVRYGLSHLSTVVDRIQGTAEIPISLLVTLQSKSAGSSMPLRNTTVVFQPGQMSATAVVPLADDNSGQFLLLLSTGPDLDELTNGIVISSPNASVIVEGNNGMELFNTTKLIHCSVWNP